MLTEAQKKQRKNGLGGTDIGAILGFSRYKTPLDVYEEKTSDAIVDESNAFMQFGQDFEPIIIRHYEQSQRCEILSDCDTLYHPQYDFLFANIDGKVKNSNIIIECKTASRSPLWGEPGTNEIPEAYLFQVAHYASIADAEKVDVAVFFRESCEHVIYTYQRNAELEAIIEERAVRFWNDFVLKRIPPEPINAEDCKRLYKSLQWEAKVADSEAQQALERYKAIKAQNKALKEEEAKLKDRLVVCMEGHERLVDSEGVTLATYRERKGAAYFDSQALKKTNPDLFKQYQLRREPTRAFCVK
ncbi:YqaJ viral recombinase family protein [Candidiatus Paracoxiella cheracis]|uniref:YqaJ viral recombinase family nuclease n=1 Tax=Candidiatus Paracoxiella cheracis TaxID=3405120 RepID=UPI003BF50446